MQEVNDSDIDFDPAKIEQMQVEFKPCPHCGGAGYAKAKELVDPRCFGFVTRIICPVCFGTGEVEMEVE